MEVHPLYLKLDLSTGTASWNAVVFNAEIMLKGGFTCVSSVSLESSPLKGLRTSLKHMSVGRACR